MDVNENEASSPNRSRESGGLLTRRDTLRTLGISRSTLLRYQKSGWLRPVQRNPEMYEYWDVNRLVGCVRRWAKNKVRLLDKRIKDDTLPEILAD